MARIAAVIEQAIFDVITFCGIVGFWSGGVDVLCIEITDTRLFLVKPLFKIPHST